MPTIHHIPLDALRAFALVVELGSVSQASQRLHRTQPAISLQLKRLQELIGHELLHFQSRQIHLTEAGQTLLQYAKTLLHLNDEIFAKFNQSSLSGTVRLGVPNEYADSFLPGILAKFAARYPEIALEVGCELSTHLLSKLEKGSYDLIFGLHTDTTLSPELRSHASHYWVEPLVWVGSTNVHTQSHAPLPLIVAPRGCVYRQRIIETLNEAQQNYRIVYTSPSFGGIKAGVLAGLGVTVLAKRAVPAGLNIIKHLSSQEMLPELKSVYGYLHYHPASASEAVLALVDHMMEVLALS